MRHIVFEDADAYPIALLIKSSAFNKQEIQTAYMGALLQGGITKSQVLALSLAYNEAGKAPVKFIKETLDQALPALDSVGTRYLYCADAAYFKALTKTTTNAESSLGYVLPCKIEGYEHMQVILGVNHRSLLYNPANEPKLDMSIRTLIDEFSGNYQAPGQDVIRHAEYPETLPEIQAILEKLHGYDELACDIETGSLRFEEAGIATITFAWNEHEGVAFACDYRPFPDGPRNGLYGELVPTPEVYWLIKRFFETYKGKIRWHNCTYDTKVLIYVLWMKDPLDMEGLLKGLHILHERIHDTKIIAYLALNSTTEVKLGLKSLAHEFAGNYAQAEINNVLAIPLPVLLEYNLVDGCCTNWVFYKYYPLMVADQQEDLYKGLMMDSQKVITQIELSGMPLNPEQVQVARQTLEHIQRDREASFVGHPVIVKLEKRLTQLEWEKDYEDRREKAKNPDKIFPKDRATFPPVTFNPSSNPQLQKLIYEEMGLPVIDLTKGKQPACGGKTVAKLLNHTTNQDHIKVLESLMDWLGANKILSTFISAFERALNKGDGVVYLHGSFNLGGTVSGRLSSSGPNLQNIPSGSTYGKLIKNCFQAPKGWLFCGADFNSLEDYVSALTTRDPNKMKVYIEGYDGHSLRAFSYWPERFPFDEITPALSFAVKEDPLLDAVRSESKTPTFLLTYGGTFHGLMSSLGWSEEKAKGVETNYHDLYQVSDEWVQTRLDQAAKDGYVTVAFGLRIRTPMLKQALRKHRRTPYAAQSEGRTAGNGLGQSYGLLTNRSCNEFMQKVWKSKYRLDIKPVAMIHDANYLMIRDDIDVVEWVNRELIKSMQWQELPELKHDVVKLGAALDIFWPTWASPITIPNDATQEEIRAKCTDFQAKLAEKQKEAA